MATTQLSDVINREVFMEYLLQQSRDKSALIQSGIVQSDPELTNAVSGGGRLIHCPIWRDLGTDESNISSDDPAQKSTQFRNLHRAKQRAPRMECPLFLIRCFTARLGSETNQIRSGR